jgi:hypothetical protein
MFRASIPSRMLLLCLSTVGVAQDSRPVAKGKVESKDPSVLPELVGILVKLQDKHGLWADEGRYRVDGEMPVTYEVGSTVFLTRVDGLQRRTRSQIFDKRILDLRSSTVRGPGSVANYERAFAVMGIAAKGLVVTPQAIEEWASHNDSESHQLMARALEDWYSRTGP